MSGQHPTSSCWDATNRHCHPDPTWAHRYGGEVAARLRGLRRFVEPGLVVLCASVALSVPHMMDGRGSPTVPPATSPSSPASRGVRRVASGHRPRLLAAQTATPGERLTVLAYRNRRLCGVAEIRLDGAPVAHRLAKYVGPLGSDWMEIFITMDVPRSAAPGRHEIELYGPKRGGSPGPICGDSREHQGKLAGRILTVHRVGLSRGHWSVSGRTDRCWISCPRQVGKAGGRAGPARSGWWCRSCAACWRCARSPFSR